MSPHEAAHVQGQAVALRPRVEVRERLVARRGRERDKPGQWCGGVGSVGKRRPCSGGDVSRQTPVRVCGEGGGVGAAPVHLDGPRGETEQPPYCCAVGRVLSSRDPSSIRWWILIVLNWGPKVAAPQLGALDMVGGGLVS